MSIVRDHSSEITCIAVVVVIFILRFCLLIGILSITELGFRVLLMGD